MSGPFGAWTDGGVTRAHPAVPFFHFQWYLSLPGRVAQRESARLTRERSQVQILPRPPPAQEVGRAEASAGSATPRLISSFRLIRCNALSMALTPRPSELAISW